MFAATAAGIYTKVEDAQKAMNSGFANEYRPNTENAAAYKEIYENISNSVNLQKKSCLNS